MRSSFDWLTLDQGEEVVWSGEPTKESMYGAYLIGVPLILAFGLGLLIVIPAHLKRKHTDYVITTNAIHKKTGVFSRSVTEIELDKVQNTTFSAGLLARKFDYGMVGISTAGGSGVEMRLTGVKNPQAVQKQLSRQVKRVQQEGDAEAETKDDVLEEILAELRGIRQSIEQSQDPTAPDWER